MFPELCCQNIILGFLKCLKIHSSHSGYVQPFLFSNDLYDCLSYCLFIKNTMYIGSAHIVKISTIRLSLSGYAILNICRWLCISLQGSLCLLYTSPSPRD